MSALRRQGPAATRPASWARWASAPPPPLVAEITPYDSQMFDDTQLGGLVSRAATFWRSRAQTPVRLLAVTEPFSAAPALQLLQEAWRATPPAQHWQRVGLQAYRIFLEQLTRQADLRHTRYYLLAWPPPSVPPQSILHAAQDSFMTPVRLCPAGLPPPFPAHLAYREGWDHLAPTVAGQPYLAVWTAWELLGQWSPYTFHQLLRQPFPLTLCLHIETPALERARTMLTNQRNAMGSQVNGSNSWVPRDPMAQAAYRDVQVVEDLLQQGERLHLVTMALLLQAPTLALLRERGAVVQQLLGSHCRLRLETGVQREALKLFTPLPRQASAVDYRAAPVISLGAGVMMPFGFRSRSETDGVLWGVDRSTGNPVFHDLWRRRTGEGSRNPHLTLIGRSGSGKTFTLLLLLYRLALTGTQVIVLDPQGHCRRLAEILGDGASYNPLVFGQAQINLLDRVGENSQEQFAHVTRQLALLLSSGTGAARRNSDQGRKVFSNRELGVLHAALRRLYAATWTRAPLLADLCGLLDDQPHGGDIAADIAALYVDGEFAGTFNAPTNVDLHLDSPAVCFDLYGMDETFRPWFYAQLLGSLTRHLRNRSRRYKRVVLAVDEYKYLANDPSLAQIVVDLTKTSRTFQAGIWTAEQDPGSYSLLPESEQILSNASLFMIGRQQTRDVEEIRRLFPRLTEAHLQHITGSGVGEFMTMLDQDYYPLQVEPSPLELAYFEGI